MRMGDVASRVMLFGLLSSALFLGLTSCGGGGGDDSGGSAPLRNRSPVAQGSIPDQILTAGDTETIFVSSYFYDPDGDTLTYETRQSPNSSGIVTVAVSGSSMTLRAIGPGSAVVRVFATDPDGLFASQDFTVGVAPAQTPNRSPVAQGSIPDQNLTVGETETVFVSSYFHDPDGDTLTYETRQSPNASGIVTVSVSGNSVILHAIGAGNAVVRVFARDSDGLSVFQDFTVRVEEMETPDLPNRDPLDDFNVTIPSSCTRQVQICVRDHQCEDGDEIRVTVNGRVEFSGELFNEPHCFNVPVQQGTNSIDLLALNGTGFKGPCDHSDVNTGAIEVSGGGTQSWRHRGGAGSTANLNITIGPPGSCPSTSQGPISSSSYGAVAFDLLDGCGYAFGVALNRSTEQTALQAAIGLCQNHGGSRTECTDHSSAYTQCAAVAYGDSQTSCYIGAGFGSTAGAARQDALADCRNEPEGYSCRILSSDDGDSAFCNE